MSVRQSWLVSTLALIVVIALSGATSGCRRGEAAAAPPFPGAKPLELACVKEHRAPTRAELEPLVRALVEVAGGDLPLKKLSFRRVEDLYLQHSGDPQSNHVLVTTWKRPDQTLRTLLEYKSGQLEQRVLFRGEEFLCARGQPLAVAITGAKQYVEWDWQLARLPQWIAEAASLDPLPLRSENGRTLVGMHVEVEGWNPPFDCFVDPGGPMVVTVETVLPVTGDLSTQKSVKQRVDFSEFRRVDGVLFPFRRDLLLDGRRFALGETRDVATGQTFEDAVFLPDGKPK